METGHYILTASLVRFFDNFLLPEWTLQGKLQQKQQTFQERMQAKMADLQIYLQNKKMDFDREMALFQVRAMRQNQILAAQDNARIRLTDIKVQDMLKTFPLKISPFVLLESKSLSLDDLLKRFRGGEANANTQEPDQDVPESSIVQLYKEIKQKRLHPDALNVFVAPIFVNTSFQNRNVLSTQIWERVYLQLESFFTQNYNRASDHPVIFYPTAWNDKQTVGMHTSETLHYFLRELPCIVIEPRFDGKVFHMMFSAWGIGYGPGSDVHHRAELSFPISLDAWLVDAAYQRSQQALKVIEEIDDALEDANMYGFQSAKDMLRRNVELYEALHIEQRLKEDRFKEVEALGIGNIFKIDPVQDLAPLADYLSSRIGLNLALLADIHHLRANDANPLLPLLFKDSFPDLYADEELRRQVADEYRQAYYLLEQEEKAYNSFLKGQERDDLKIDMEGIRKAQMLEVDTQLALVSKEEAHEELEQEWRRYASQEMGIEGADDLPFEELVDRICDKMEMKHRSFFEEWLPKVEDKKISRKIRNKL